MPGPAGTTGQEVSDLICKVSLERLDHDSYRLAWGEEFTAGRVDIRLSPRPDVPADTEVAAEGVHGGADIVASGGSPRWYFRLDGVDEASLVIGERGVSLEGGVNFRDLGGYAGADGRRIRWGRLFRSGHLSQLTAADRQVISGLGISTVCDYRHPDELVNEHAELPNSPEVRVLGIPPGVGHWRMLHDLFAQTSDPADTVEAMHQIMVYLVREAAPYYQDLFDALLAPPPGAFLMHCSGGKERSGVGAALTLAAMGVPRETIMYDYMLSSRYTPVETQVPRVLDKYEVSLPPEQGRALVLPLLETRPSYLNVVFDAIEADHGSIAAFLRERFGIDDAARERLCELYME